MKANRIFLGLMLGALCLTACEKEELKPEAGNKTITINALAQIDPISKTYINDAGKPSWREADKLSFYTTNNVDFTPIDFNKLMSVGTITDGVAANFTGTINEPAGDATYAFYAFYPSEAYYSTPTIKTIEEIRITIPSVQNPTTTSFDPLADILLAKPVKDQTILASDREKSINFQFGRAISVIHMNFTTFTGVSSSEKITKVTLSKTGDDTNYLTGRFKINLETSTLDRWSATSAPYKVHSVTAVYNLSSAPTLAEANVYLTVAPFTLAKDATLTVTIETETHIITKVVTAPEDKFFLEGNLSHLTMAIDSHCSVQNIPEKTIPVIKEMADGTVSEVAYFVGKVISDRSTANVGTNELYVQSGTSENCGILVKTQADHSFNLGDSVKIFISGGTIATSNNIKSFTPIKDESIIKTASSLPLSATSISVEQLKSGAYSSMYVAIPGVQVTAAKRGATVLGTTLVETVNNSFNLYVRGTLEYGPSFKSSNLPSGNGTLKGIASCYSSNYQVIPQSESDFSGLTGDIITTFGTPALTGTMTKNSALSGCTITIPVRDFTSPASFKVSVSATGVGSAGITNPFALTSVSVEDNQLTCTLSGTPAAIGDVTFTIDINSTYDEDICSLTVNGTVVDGAAATYSLVTEAPADWSGTYLIVGTKDSKYYTLGTQTSNNISQVEISINGSQFVEDAQSSLAKSEVRIAKIGETSTYSIQLSSTFATAANANYYLYAAHSSSNYLRSRVSNPNGDLNGNWAITLSEGTFSIVAQGSNTRNVMQYNSGSSLFSCYGSASQKPVCLYKKN